MTATFGLAVISTIARSSTTVAIRNTLSDPNFWPSRAPSIVKPATATEWATMAVPTAVAGA